MATFYPVYEAARQVGGQQALVQLVVPPGTEPHDYEPTPRDVAALSDAAMVVFNGVDFEPWLERLLPDLEKKGVVLVDASKTIDLLEMEDEVDPSRKVPDPHFWLDPVLMQQIVLAVKDGYVRMDPAGRPAYEANAIAYNAKLEALHRKYQRELEGFKNRTFVTAHAAFAYLAKRYDLEMIPIAGVNPTDEPSPREMAAIVRLAREKGIKHIFFETLVSPRLAETIAREVGAGTLVLNPLEGLEDEEIKAGADYISVMEENLANLKTALQAIN